jgi:hypothetical protein
MGRGPRGSVGQCTVRLAPMSANWPASANRQRDGDAGRRPNSLYQSISSQRVRATDRVSPCPSKPRGGRVAKGPKSRGCSTAKLAAHVRAAMRDRPGSEAEIGFRLAAARREEEISGERPEDWATLQLRECSETEEGVARESKGVKSCPRAGCGKSACPVVCPANSAGTIIKGT